MTLQTALRQHLKHLIIRVCDVRDVRADEVEDDELLFGPTSRLGLTSLDAIEIAIGIERELKVKMSNMSSARDYFRSIATLSDHIAERADPAVVRDVLKVAG